MNDRFHAEISDDGLWRVFDRKRPEESDLCLCLTEQDAERIIWALTAAVPCERCCSATVVEGELYCKGCGVEVIRELKAMGYLDDASPPYTGSEARGRKSRSSQVLGGAAEWRSDGDEW